MNKLRWMTLIASLACLASSAFGGDALFEWTGASPLPGKNALSPTVAAPDPALGMNPILKFADGQYLEIPMNTCDLPELTVALFVRPAARGATENLVTWQSGANDGFALYKMHGNWGFAAGDGEKLERRHSGIRADFLRRNQWQHLAVTFDRGNFRYYKDGVLTVHRRVPLKEIRLMDDAPLRLGGNDPFRSHVLPFEGEMAGIIVLDRKLEPREITALMSHMNP